MNRRVKSTIYVRSHLLAIGAAVVQPHPKPACNAPCNMDLTRASLQGRRAPLRSRPTGRVRPNAPAKWANWLKLMKPVQGPPASNQASWRAPQLLSSHSEPGSQARQAVTCPTKPTSAHRTGAPSRSQLCKACANSWRQVYKRHTPIFAPPVQGARIPPGRKIGKASTEAFLVKPHTWPRRCQRFSNSGN